MNEFFQVTDTHSVLAFKDRFPTVGSERVPLEDALGRILARDIAAQSDIPGFDRSTMDGYAVSASSTFGASEGNPAYLTVVGSIDMGRASELTMGAGQAARIATGGMLPGGADSVIMVEHTDVIDDTTIEVHRSVAPGQHVVARDEDAAQGQTVLLPGTRLRAQELGVLAACGVGEVQVFRRPKVGIISTGDEVVPVTAVPRPGQVRDVNSHTLSGLVHQAGAQPVRCGIVIDQFDDLLEACRQALAETDMVLISGGSSVGTRDLTVDVLEALPKSRILVHGVSVRPGKPTILAQCDAKAVWGLPGHVTSAMVVFMVLVEPFLAHLGGHAGVTPVSVRARLTRNLASVQGRVDYVRVRLIEKDGQQWAEPILGASGLIRTMAAAQGLVALEMNSEGLDLGAWVDVVLM